MRVGQREADRVVVKGRRLPGAGVVALLAGLREISTYVIGILGALVIRQMAAYACRGGQVVVVVDVTVETRARRVGVRVGERKAYGRMVEGGRLPGAGVVALLTGLREPAGHMVGILRALIVLQVTGHASGRREVVIVVDVAVETDARRIGVRIRQREAGAGVIEFGIKPGVRAVALFAIR